MVALRRAAVVGLLLVTPPAALGVEPALSRAIEAARASPHLPEAVLDQAEADCATALCFAQTLSARLPGHVRLEAVDHPDTDSIRWVRTNPSVSAEVAGGRLHLRLAQFGRKAVSELREALADHPLPIELDLRGNAGGDFERMLVMAGALIGPRRGAVEIRYRDHTELRDLEGPRDRTGDIVRVLIDRGTASAALLLARLLEVFAGAEVIDPPLRRSQIFLKRRVTIDHDWRLVFPVATLRTVSP
jgi:hypothetical protein